MKDWPADQGRSNEGEVERILYKINLQFTVRFNCLKLPRPEFIEDFSFKFQVSPPRTKGQLYSMSSGLGKTQILKRETKINRPMQREQVAVPLPAESCIV